MLDDAFLPPGLRRPRATVVERSGRRHRCYRPTPELCADLGRRLASDGRRALLELPGERLLTAWEGAVAALLDPASPEHRAVAPALAAGCRLSPPGLEAGLAAVLGGVRGAPARELLARGAALAAAAPAQPVLVVLAGNLPALAVQPLLPALALRRPVVLKSPSEEPLFAPALAAALARREPRLARAVAALTFPGGDAALEAPLLAVAGCILAYGGAEAIDHLSRRAPGKVVAYGPKASLAVVGREADRDLAAVARGLARDVALFDQRGCLSIVAVYAEGETLPRRLAAALAEALAGLARELPPGPVAPAEAAAVQQLRGEAVMRGLPLWELAPAEGTVVLDPDPAFRPGSGLRAVRVHPVADLTRLPPLLAPARGWLQGAALAGDSAWALAGELTALGISRLAVAGELQSPDARWHNGGVDPLAVLAAPPG